MKNKIVIIGGSGFIGSHLIEILNKENCMNFDKNQSPFFPEITVIGNILDKPLLEKKLKGAKTIVLLAAEHRDNVSPISLYYDINVDGTKNVLEAMNKNQINHLIFTSSVAVYGLNKNNPTEENPTDPFNDYGKSKLLAEREIEKWFNHNPTEKEVTIIRPTVVFGERNRGNVYNLLKQITSNKFVMIGNGNNKKSMAYVKNIVSYIASKINTPEKGLNVYNYADKPDFSMNELVKNIYKIMKFKRSIVKIPYIIGMSIGFCFDILGFLIRKKLVISSVRVKKFCATTQFDSSKVFDDFKPPFALKKGLENTLKHEFLNKNKV